MTEWKKIPLTQGQFSIVDEENYDYLNSFKWFAHYSKCTKTFYAEKSSSRKNHPKGKQFPEFLHWYVIGKPLKGFIVDHINGNTLDNRRKNLRVLPFGKNQQNRKSHRFGNLAGCTWSFKSKKWQAKCQFKNKTIHIGFFDNQKEAHEAYLNKINEFYLSGNTR